MLGGRVEVGLGIRALYKVISRVEVGLGIRALYKVISRVEVGLGIRALYKVINHPIACQMNSKGRRGQGRVGP